MSAGLSFNWVTSSQINWPTSSPFPADNSAPLTPVMGSFSPTQHPSPLGCDQPMMPSPQDESMAGSPADVHNSLTHSMIRDINTSSSSMDLVSPTSPVSSGNNNSNHNNNNNINNNNHSNPTPSGSVHLENMYSNTHQQQVTDPIGVKYQQSSIMNNSNNSTSNSNNNNYMLNNNNNSNNNSNSVDYGAHHPSVQLMVSHQQVLPPTTTGSYGQQGGPMAHPNMYGQMPSPREDRPAMNMNGNNNNNSSNHKITVKCAAELIHGVSVGGGGGGGEMPNGLRTSFKKEPEHRY